MLLRRVQSAQRLGMTGREINRQEMARIGRERDALAVCVDVVVAVKADSGQPPAMRGTAAEHERTSAMSRATTQVFTLGPPPRPQASFL